MSILLGRKLFQQFVVDLWAAGEQNQLMWIKSHQKELHAEQYQGAIDAFGGREITDPQSIGTGVILPASFSGSIRDMLTNLQNALALS